MAILCVGTLQMEGQQRDVSVREIINLSGRWRIQTDTGGVGIKRNWQDSNFKKYIQLPGSLEENNIGTPVIQATTLYLNQKRTYIGAAWFQRTVEIPSSWKYKQVVLFLERTKATWVWIDDLLIGQSNLLSAPQVFSLPAKLSTGRHVLTICVDNSPSLFSVGGSHALSQHTQTNWNGIIGKIYLEATPNLKINWVKVSSDIKTKTAFVKLSVLNKEGHSQKIWIELQAKTANTSQSNDVPSLRFNLDLQERDTIVTVAYPLGNKAQLWSEFDPVLYLLHATLHRDKAVCDSVDIHFGLREFKVQGTQFAINDVITFLRGKNEGCVFPLTGYPSMDVASWRHLFQTAKNYGINHYRFHSYTPPEAAFEAADREGIYIQAELPNWADFRVNDSIHTMFQYREGMAILDAYGNHPSFVMFSLGNELGGDEAIHDKMVSDLRRHDSRRLYIHGTNAFYNNPAPGINDDYWVTMRTGKETSDGRFDVRASFATTEARGNGIINSLPPSASRNFSSALKGIAMPVIGHETGQYQIYPDYREIPAYKGVLLPLNFEIFRQRLQNSGMGDQAYDFFRASGILTALLYREEIEMAFRTPGFAGFQLLDLQDYPGQGTALVGLLNAFMKNKGLISDRDFRRFNNNVVLQLLMDKYVWTNDEAFSAKVQLVNYSRDNIEGKKLLWRITASGGRLIDSGTMAVSMAQKGMINPLGNILFPLNKIKKAVELSVQLEIPGTPLEISYPVWIYPAHVDLTVPSGIIVSTHLDDKLKEQLINGANVLLFPDHEQTKQKTVGGQFISEFWNWLVFKKAAENMKRPVSAGTLGLLIHQEHPLFHSFPTEFYSNWQWWSIARNARPLILDSTTNDYRPIVQVIDNIDRNHKLGMIFEWKSGKGKLLVCMADLPSMMDKPEARQLYYSMLQYMRSGKFDPVHNISIQQLTELL